jgi:alkylated DNA repair protein (DNA oxidative demethylase)
MTLFAGQRETFADGMVYVPGYFDAAAQQVLLREIEAVIAAAPLFQPRMPKSGKPFSVEMTNCGPLGWLSDRDGGYRYQATHPETGRPWPPIPALALKAWSELGAYPHVLEACLVNVYGAAAHMGLHQDKDEANLAAPVVSLSLGESGVFRWGGTSRGGRTQSITLASGDAVVLAGEARLAFHAVPRILQGTSDLLPGRRINLTLRRVTAPQSMSA